MENRLIIQIYRMVATRYRVFDDVPTMNEHVQAHVIAAGRRLHKNARAVLNVVARHSCRVAGVSWLRDDTIAAAVGVSVRTAQRALDRLEELGIGRRVVVRENGLQMRYFVLNRFEIAAEVSPDETVASPCESTGNDANIVDETMQARETIKHSQYVKGAQLPADYTPSNVPAAFVAAVKPFYNDADRIYRLWGVALRANRNAAMVLDTVIGAWRQSVFMLKTGRLRRSVEGYFYGALSGMLAVQQRQQTGYVSPFGQALLA